MVFELQGEPNWAYSWDLQRQMYHVNEPSFILGAPCLLDRFLWTKLRPIQCGSLFSEWAETRDQMVGLCSHHVPRKYYCIGGERVTTTFRWLLDLKCGDTEASPRSKWSRELSVDTAGKRFVEVLSRGDLCRSFTILRDLRVNIIRLSKGWSLLKISSWNGNPDV